MHATHPRVIVLVLAVLILFGCNLPGGESSVTPVTSPTLYFMTLSALQTRAVMTATSQGVFAGTIPTGATPAPIPQTGPGTGTPLGGTPANGTVVINDTLCWLGPGPRFETISAIFRGTLIKLLGRSAAPGWYIVLNPVYQDPCWVQASDVQVEAGIDVNALPIYADPATPTFTPFPTRTLGAPTQTSVPPTLTLPAPSLSPAPSLPPPATNTPPAAPTDTPPPPTPTSAPSATP